MQNVNYFTFCKLNHTITKERGGGLLVAFTSLSWRWWLMMKILVDGWVTVVVGLGETLVVCSWLNQSYWSWSRCKELLELVAGSRRGNVVGTSCGFAVRRSCWLKMEGLLNVTMERKKEGRKTMRIVGGGRVCFLG